MIKLWVTRKNTKQELIASFPAKRFLEQKYQNQTYLILDLDVHPTKNLIAYGGSGDFGIRIWNCNFQQKSPTLIGNHSSMIYQVKFSPDGRRLATSSVDGMIKIWSIGSSNQPKILAEILGHSSPVYGLAFSKNGEYLVSGSGDKTIKVWDLKAVIKEYDRKQRNSRSSGPVNEADPDVLKSKLLGHTADVNGVEFAFIDQGNGSAFKNDLLLVSASSDGTIRLWEWGNNNRTSERSSTIDDLLEHGCNLLKVYGQLNFSNQDLLLTCSPYLSNGKSSNGNP